MEMSHPCRLFILLQNSTGCGQSKYDGEKIRAFNNYTAYTTFKDNPPAQFHRFHSQTDSRTPTLTQALCILTACLYRAGTPEIPGVLHTRTPHTMTPPV